MYLRRFGSHDGYRPIAPWIFASKISYPGMDYPYPRQELYDTGPVRSFDRTASAVAFPLGGIGTGNVSLGVRGQLRDWELFNHPGKDIDLPYAFVGMRCSREHDAVTRVLEAKRTPPHTNWSGLEPTTTAGLPRLDDVEFTGTYPIAHLMFRDADLPVEVSLEAYTPFIPLHPADSGIPCAVLEYTISNPTPDPVDVSLVGSLPNVMGYLGETRITNPRLEHPELGGNQNTTRSTEGLEGIHYTTEQYDRSHRRYGEMALCMLGESDIEFTHKAAWDRGEWWNGYQRFWNEFREDGRLDPNRYSEPSPDGRADVGSVAGSFELAPGTDQTVRFLLTWYLPNRPEQWNAMYTSSDDGCCSGDCVSMVQNQYATMFDGAWDVAAYVASEYDRLREDTYAFRDAFFDSSVPTHVLDAVSSQLSVARSTTCLWFDDGRFLGFEGCTDQQGCCEGTCTHVWNYAQSLARLFPSLEREMRRIDFEESTDESGRMAFRTSLPFDGDPTGIPAADGQMGTIMRLYREWRFSGDDAFLEQLWPHAKRTLEFAFDEWDPDENGVMTEAQHNTYDIEFYGPNTMMGTWYLGALRAGSKMARHVGDLAAADRYDQLFAAGQTALNDACWNGEYYVQAIDDVDDYQYQYGEGCLIDQVVGDWYARMLKLGATLPESHVDNALGALFEHNFLDSFSRHHNCNRTFALNDDAGLLMCTWPRGGRPEISFPYCDEVMSGFAYQAAAHMVYAGLIEEGLTIVKAIRDRHDGVKRNPWNEFECGNHYARTMANWSVYEAVCGYDVDLTGQHETMNEHGFSVDPLLSPENGFRGFWITNDAWGSYEIERGAANPSVTVLHER